MRQDYKFESKGPIVPDKSLSDDWWLAKWGALCGIRGQYPYQVETAHLLALRSLPTAADYGRKYAESYWQNVSDPMACALCRTHEETLHHIFWDCPWATLRWQGVYNQSEVFNGFLDREQALRHTKAVHDWWNFYNEQKEKDDQTTKREEQISRYLREAREKDTR